MIFDLDIWDPNILLKIDNIKTNLRPHDIVILNAVQEFRYNMLYGTTENVTKLIDLVKERNAKLQIITCSHPSNKLLETNDNVEIEFWPEYWTTLTYYRLLVVHNHNPNIAIGCNVENIETGKKFPYFKYPFISMNKAPKLHRAFMMDMLAKHDLIGKGAITWREPNVQHSFKYWKQEILLLDQKDQFQSQERVPIEYPYSMMQLVPESDEDLFMVSEKTSIPLLFNKPFLVAGCVNYHKILQELGFKLYDELFDYSFDSEKDIFVRYDMIAENLKRYADKSPKQLKEIYDSVFEKCVYNKKHIMKIATDTKLIPNSYKTLVKYHEENNIDSLPTTINNFIKTKQDDYRFQ